MAKASKGVGLEDVAFWIWFKLILLNEVKLLGADSNTTS